MRIMPEVSDTVTGSQAGRAAGRGGAFSWARPYRQAGLVLGLTLGVNVLNYVRDALVVARLGAGEAADAFFSALLIPAMLQQVLVGGALAAALVAVTEERRPHDAAAADATASGVVSAVALVWAAPLALATLFAPALVGALLPGFGPAGAELTAAALRLLLPGSLPLVLAGLAGALLAARGHYALQAASPALLAAGVLAVLVVAPQATVVQLAAGAAVGMAAQLAVQLPALAATGHPLRPIGAWRAFADPDVRRVAWLAAPLLAYVSLSHVMTLVERVFASGLGAGAVARLALAQKVAALPLFLIAGSLAAVVFPRLASAAEPGAFRADLDEALGGAVPALLFGTAWLLGAGGSFVAVLYRHGSFTAADAAATTLLLRGYALGLLPAGVGMLLLKALHARQDGRAPLAVMAIVLPAYLALAGTLSPRLGALGLAFALSAATLLSTVLLAYALSRRHRALASLALTGRVAAWLPAGAAALVVALAIERSLGDPFAVPLLPRLARLVGVSGAAALVFAGGAWATRRLRRGDG